MNRREWITPALEKTALGSERRPTWWMRSITNLERIPSEARLFIVCLGYYELYVNGDRVDEEPLAPSFTRPDRRGLRIAHEIAPYLREGDNCIALWCSSGWYLPNQFEVHHNWSPLLRVEWPGRGMDWHCRQSNRDVIDLWQWNRFGGEEVRAEEYLPNWNRRECDLEGWHRARNVSPPPIVLDDRSCPPNRIGETYQAQSSCILEDGRIEVDFGTCLSGWADIRFKGLSRGQRVTLEFYDLSQEEIGELEKNGRIRRFGKSGPQIDQSYHQKSVYVAKGGSQDRFTNKFNYAGFRYVVMSGWTEPPALSDMKAFLIESAMERTGRFSCSNGLYNRIHDLNVHTLRCLDLGGYSVDCPQRERQGYGADGQTSLPAYLFLLDSQAFLRKWLTDWTDIYEPETGRISHCAPNVHSEHSPAWGGIVAPLAWSLHVYFGRRDALEEAYPMILGYIRFLQKAAPRGIMEKDLLGSIFHGDWVAPGRGMDSDNTPDLPMKTLFNSCYLIYLWEILIKIAGVLGRDEILGEAEAAMALLREAVHREFYNQAEGYYLIPEQAYQALPLLTGVVPEELRESVQDKLITLIKDRGWHMDAGLPGTTLLLMQLEQAERHDVIARIYNRESYPGWGYMVAQGATTIWEQWNGFWSQIHSCFAGPASWFYTGLGGIRPDEDKPGFAGFTLAPAFVSQVDSVHVSYESCRGLIESRWQREGDTIHWEITVPETSSASVRIPEPADGILVNNGESLKEVNSVSDARGADCLEFSLTPGSYSLSWRIGTRK